MNEDIRIYSFMQKYDKSDLLSIGDKVKIEKALHSTKLFSVLGGKTYTVDEIRPVTQWMWLPFQQFIGLAGIQDLYFNTVLVKQ